MGRLVTARHTVQRFAFLLLVAAAFFLMVLGRADNALVDQVRATVTDALSPLFSVLSRPATAIADVVHQVRDLADLRADNAHLRAENRNLLQWEAVARHLEDENAILRTQLNYIPDPDPAYITTRVIGDMGSNFGRSMLLGAGSGDGIRKGQAVLAGQSLIGYISDVGARSSRLLLLTDINAHIPVMIQSTHARAILSGDNHTRMRLANVAGDPTLRIGDRVVTSASGAAFPPGLPVGIITAVGDHTAWVSPYTHRYQLQYVTVVDYGLGGIQTFTDVPARSSRHRGRGRR
jgi:rod shape-determining protein MreC